MRILLHAVALVPALVLFIVLEPAIRIGRISILAGILSIASTVGIVYGLVILALGVASGLPISRWPAIAREVFRIRDEQ